MQVTALNNQTLLDVAIRHCGTVESVADIAILNNISITDDLVPGQLILIPSKDYGNQEVVTFFSQNKIDPATALTEEQLTELNPTLGIGKMKIGSTFIVR